MLVGAGIEHGFRNYLPVLEHIPLRSSPDVPLFGVRGLLSSDGSFALGLVFLVGAGIFATDSLCLRLAADDREVAMFCVIFRGTDYEHSKKSLVFLPRAAYHKSHK
jgi:hypothetical protein